ncbi:TIGR03571 family LLM class oxidoreductase [Risungbinella massiliensis]|uniref:TIGR03571 family LLM class oxidoreductase n=1 Tax=Risungbinella massiliensis TaxID=1329796 RepID=UPI0005CC8BCD|nr:TIGR03571 family LLM class oxidoreductase [Risungbinella massiliensis]
MNTIDRITTKNMTIGIQLPLDQIQGEEEQKRRREEGVPFPYGVPDWTNHAKYAKMVDQLGFAAIWMRDVPLYDPYRYGDAGPVFDPIVYLGYLSAITQQVVLGTGAIVLTLRHPIHVAKAAATIDQLSKGRLLLGIATGDRPVEFPIFGVDRRDRGVDIVENVSFIQKAWQDGPLFENGVELLPKPYQDTIPIVMAGRGSQTIDWIAQNLNGWFDYPRGIGETKRQIEKWKKALTEAKIAEKKPYLSNFHLQLHENPEHPLESLRFGGIIGRNALIRYLHKLEEIGLDHLVFHLSNSERTIPEVLEELAEFVLPEFPTHEISK